jgi:hypothetical protein
MDVFHNDIRISIEGEGIIGTTIRSMQQARFTHTVGQNRAEGGRSRGEGEEGGSEEEGRRSAWVRSLFKHTWKTESSATS